jgi:hypothetical protein
MAYLGNDVDAIFIPGSVNTSTNLTITGGALTQTGGDVNFDSGTLFIDEDVSRVGIGTTSPISSLHVRAASNGGISVDAGSGYPAIWWSENGVNKWSVTSNLNADSAFVVRESGVADRLNIKIGGNVGIGTTNPEEKLHVQGVGIITSTLYVGGTSSSSNSLEISNSGQDILRPGGRILLRGGGGQSTRNSIELTNNAGIIIDGGSGETYGVEIKGGGGPVKITQGNVGIGTTNPTSRFETQEDTTSNTDLTITNANTGVNTTKGARIRFRLTDTVGTRKNVAFISAYSYNQDSSAGNYLTFSTRTTDSDPTEKVRITNTGNVGIGITNPSDTLHVSGTINATSDMSLGGELNFYNVSDKFVDFYTNTGQTANLRLVDSGSTSFHSAVRLIRGGAVELYHNNTKRLETTSSGILISAPNLGANIGDTVTLADFVHNNGGNVSYLRVISRRNSSTQNWTGASTKIVNVTDVTYQGYIEFNADGAPSSIALGQGGSEYVRVVSNGNVGIGRTNPESTLHVAGTFRSTLNSGAGGDTLLSSINGVSNGYITSVDTSNNITYRWNTGSNNQAMMIDASGNVGIGTTPAYKFDVGGGVANIASRTKATTGESLRLSTTDSTDRMELLFSHATNSYWRIQAVEQSVSYRPLVLNNDGGNVGVGTTAPGTKLHIYDNTDSSSVTYTQNASTGTNAFSAFTIRAGSTQAWWWVNSQNRSADGGVSTSTLRNDGGSLRLQATSNDGIFIKGGATHVGIGTENPVTTLDIRGSTAESLYIRRSDIANIYGFMGVSTSNTFRIGSYITGTGWGNIIINDGGGNVGIGTTNPTVRLQVDGAVAASSTGGFLNTTFAINARNPIWRFGNADAYGLSYFQGTAGVSPSAGGDTIGFHFGTATAAASLLQINAGRGIVVNGAQDNIIASESGTSNAWRGVIRSTNSSADRTSFLGTYAGVGGVFCHNHAFSAWADLYVNTVDGTSGGRTIIANTTSVLTTLGTRTNGTTYGGNTAGLTLNSVAEVRSAQTANPPALTFHYEGIATRHLLLNSSGQFNFVSPTSENSGVAVVLVNGNTVWHAGNDGALFNNMGATHTARSSFDATSPSYGFGYRYVQGATNGPGTGGTQFYSWYIGLGSDYGPTGATSYGAMFAVDRNVAVPYLSVRYNEGNNFTSWRKISAGFADSSSRLYSTDSVYSYGSSNPYYGYLTYIGGNSRWRFQVAPATPAAVEVAYADYAGGAASTPYPVFSGDSVDVANITSRIDSGFYQQSSPTTANGWPYNGSWAHLLACTHANDANYYSMQFAASFYANDLYYRSTNGNGGTGWSRVALYNNSFSGDLYANVFRDSNDPTNYYLDPNGSSQLYRVRVGPYAGSTSNGNQAGLEMLNSGGTGDGNVAAISFHCAGSYGVHLHLRHDGYFGAGGWSASTWRWYVNMTNGDMTAAGNVTAYSDIRLKEEIEPLQNSLEKLMQINGVSFRWKDLPEVVGHPGKKDFGIIAQEVEKVFPEVIHQSAHESPDGDPYKTVAYDKLVPVLLEAIKEQQKQIDELREEIKQIRAGR